MAWYGIFKTDAPTPTRRYVLRGTRYSTEKLAKQALTTLEKELPHFLQGQYETKEIEERLGDYWGIGAYG